MITLDDVCQIASMIGKDECPPVRSAYLCMRDETEEGNCVECWPEFIRVYRDRLHEIMRDLTYRAKDGKHVTPRVLRENIELDYKE